MGKRKFYFEPEEFVKDYEELKSSRAMAQKYNCDKGTILEYANKIGYINNYRPQLTEEQKAEIIQKYYTHKSQELAVEYGVSKSYIIKLWSNANIENKKLHRIYHLNDDYFNTINTKDKAYFLGLLASDGNVFNRNNGQSIIIRLSLQSVDAYILERFKDYIGSDKPLHYTRPSDKNRKEVCSIEIVSKKMGEDLKKYGVVPQKTYDFVMPDIPAEFISHYLRGYFDGDGSITLRDSSAQHLPYSYMCSYAGFIPNLSKMQKKLTTAGIDSRIQKDNRDYHGEFGSLVISSIDNVNKFLDYIYKDCDDLYIPRKIERYKNFKSALNNRRKKRRNTQ